MPRDAPVQAPVFRRNFWPEHVELLRLFLQHRNEIVEGIQDLLNAQRKPVQYLQDRPLLSLHFEDCFFQHPAVTEAQAQLRGQLEQAHWSAGFTPRQLPGLHNDLIHPAEMMIRGFHFWHQTRWPGRKGRMHYAQTLFNVYLLRCLELLSMRVFDQIHSDQRDSDHDTAPTRAGARLAELQGLLDELWRGSPADQPAFVRDARWLIPLAQSLPTDELAPYLEVVRQVAEALPAPDALEIQRAQVRMLGGHLTSQIRRYCTKDDVPIDEPSVVLRTRTSNALDFALIIQGLVALLQAYDRALQSGDEPIRLRMAGAIFQGISPDPELFLNRVDLLGAYSMIEHVFVAPHDGEVSYTLLGQQHVRLLQEYGALMDRLAQPLRDDFPRFRPVDGGCSPYGVIFGTPTILTELMALKALERDAETRFSLEEAFNDDVMGEVGDDGDPGASKLAAAKLAWVDGWRKLPHIDPEVQRQYEYPQQFAEEIYNRIARELDRRDRIAETDDVPKTGRLYLVSGAEGESNDMDAQASAIPEVPAKYFASSDKQMVAEHRAESCEAAQLLHERNEGLYLVSYETQGGWMALKKTLLEEILAAGRDARIVALPPEAAQVLRLMCFDLVIVEGSWLPPLEKN